MLLTGKAKFEFENWFEKQRIMIGFREGIGGRVVEIRNCEVFPESIIEKFVIDFLDTKGIYIADWGVNNVEGEIGFDSQVMYQGKLYSTSENFSKTRTEAITNAINKANDIFNGAC